MAEVMLSRLEWLADRLRVYFELRDAWIGFYVARDAVYVCPVPFLVIAWKRKGKAGG